MSKPPALKEGEFLLYETEDGQSRIDVRVDGDTVWLSLKQLTDLFGRDKSVISRHLKNVFDEGELVAASVVADFATTAADGKSYQVTHYNLDVIISVGYRVKSLRGTQFRIWATQRLREYLVKGFAMDDERLKEGGRSTYFDELLARIRDIRSSEKMFWQKVLEIYATSIDYSPRADESQRFFATVQNKMHWAAHGQTAAEVIASRADAGRPNMGLTNWKGVRPRLRDVEIAKNYLSADELNVLNRLTSMYLDFAELQATRRRPMRMEDWNRKDIEQYRRVLAPKLETAPDGETFDARQKLRDDFYEALTAFGLCLQTALGSRSFFEDGSFSERLIESYKQDLRWFTSLRKIARQDAMETVDYSVYEEQIRRLVDKQVIGREVREAEGVYVVHELGKDEEPSGWSEDKTRNETDLIRTRLRKTIDHDLADDPYAQKVFSDLLKQAIAEAEAMFDHPLKQYALFKAFEARLDERQTPGVPVALHDDPHAKAYFGAIRLVVGERWDVQSEAAFVDEARAIDHIVKTAVAENSLNPQNIEAAIRKELLPRLFGLLGLEAAKSVIDQVVHIARLSLARSA